METWKDLGSPGTWVYAAKLASLRLASGRAAELERGSVKVFRACATALCSSCGWRTTTLIKMRQLRDEIQASSGKTRDSFRVFVY